MLGHVHIANGTSGRLAIYECEGTVHAVSEISDPAGTYTVTAANAGTTNIYWSAANSRYEIENKTGATVVYTIWHVSG